MKTVEETRRDLFENWLRKQLHVVNIGKSRGEYILKEDQDQWIAFNAALDAIEIELPSVYDFHSTSGMKRGCKESIESLNLGIKVK